MARKRDKANQVPAESRSDAGQVADFLAQAQATPAPAESGGETARLIFGIDATASRQPTWDLACETQAEMFEATRELGGLAVQLVYYRGFGEFEASAFRTDTQTLLREMTGVQCLGGRTQIRRVLRHARNSRKKRKINAVVFVGDCMEEDVDELCHLAGELGLMGVPCFMFHEGRDRSARRAFEQVAKLSGGACVPFDARSAQTLKELLGAVAAFAAGGQPALESYSRGRGETVKQLTHQVGNPGGGS